MSERPKWMPESISVHSAPAVPEWRWQGDVSPICLCADCLHYATGLRAQIAVLEDLISHMSQRYASQENPTGSYCNEESCWIAEKIAALRKELGE